MMQIMNAMQIMKNMRMLINGKQDEYGKNQNTYEHDESETDDNQFKKMINK